MARKKSKNLEAQRLCQQVLTAGFFGFWEGCKHITQLADSKHQPHLTSPCIKLRGARIKNSKIALYLDLT
ncbi:hypothetical protein CGH21_04065 [Vibrio parahaemolyticus]|nr:hypothetical protein CGK05_09730 [Vibrio parahaemolyticus]TOF08722.1 hypothetical protein CGJ29_06590 [Vibrio parahaemolyticus]TOG41212.1 hypothetical protein CGJ02_13035 [Vibrio parahaemolyticus]TOI69156.1 hypothetical protein CGI56_04430 [Vibrio parahaemolyticus]TOK26126.1 hypothetical protein CGI22_08320 [Vibrio parahaemolyticus]